MEVGRQVQGRPEALDERDRAALSLADAEVHSRAAPLVREDGSQEAAQDLAREPRVPGAAEAKRIGQREHPLSDRDLGQHPVDEMGRGVGHATTATGRTEAAALAREGDEAVVAAGVAVDPEKSVGEHTTLEVRADLALDEASDGGARPSRSCEERQQLRSDDLVEECLLGPPHAIARQWSARRTSASTSQSC